MLLGLGYWLIVPAGAVRIGPDHNRGVRVFGRLFGPSHGHAKQPAHNQDYGEAIINPVG